jgi:hypothetical protein
VLLKVAFSPSKSSCSTVSRHSGPRGSMVQVTREGRSRAVYGL